MPNAPLPPDVPARPAGRRSGAVSSGDRTAVVVRSDGAMKGLVSLATILVDTPYSPVRVYHFDANDPRTAALTGGGGRPRLFDQHCLCPPPPIQPCGTPDPAARHDEGSGYVPCRIVDGRAGFIGTVGLQHRGFTDNRCASHSPCPRDTEGASRRPARPHDATGFQEARDVARATGTRAQGNHTISAPLPTRRHGRRRDQGRTWVSQRQPGRSTGQAALLPAARVPIEPDPLSRC